MINLYDMESVNGKIETLERGVNRKFEKKLIIRPLSYP